jgi:hypothetical protein
VLSSSPSDRSLMCTAVVFWTRASNACSC